MFSAIEINKEVTNVSQEIESSDRRMQEMLEAMNQINESS